MSRFKTELCNNLIELGCCKYGDRCHYAHGHHELRQVSRRHPKYRTERCKNFELTGKCPFGPRCSYVHPKPDLDSMIEQLSKYMQHTKAPKPDSEDDDDDDISFFGENRVTAAEAAAAAAAAAVASDTKASSAAAASLSNTSMIRTPLGSNNSSNILPSMNFSNNTTILQHSSTSHNNLQATNNHIFQEHNQQNTPLLQATDQINGTSSKSILSPNTNNTIASTGIKGCTYSDNFSFNDSSISFENHKKPRLISTNPSSNSNNQNNTASNPFGIRNPLSDYLNNSNINGKSPLQPNKQFYIRF